MKKQNVLVVGFPVEREVAIFEEEPQVLAPDQVRIRTLYSGISAGTELSAYRGTNPYLTRRWDGDRRLFVDGESTATFPLNAWGYEEVGEIVELGSEVAGLKVGERVWGTWGHRTETVQDETFAAQRILPAGIDARVGMFSQIGATSLNVVLDADIHIGETVAVFGLGVPGQIAAQLARLNGGRVIGIDGIASRREKATQLGAELVLDPADGPVAERIREITDGRGADVCLEITGNYRALHEAIRAVAYSSRVCAAGFMQGEGVGLRLGEEFHHNRVQVVSTQVGGVAPALQHRWDGYRLARTAIDVASSGRLNVVDLISHTMPFESASDAFRMLDTAPDAALQVVLDYTKEIA